MSGRGCILLLATFVLAILLGVFIYWVQRPLPATGKVLWSVRTYPKEIIASKLRGFGGRGVLQMDLQRGQIAVVYRCAKPYSKCWVVQTDSPHHVAVVAEVSQTIPLSTRVVQKAPMRHILLIDIRTGKLTPVGQTEADDNVLTVLWREPRSAIVWRDGRLYRLTFPDATGGSPPLATEEKLLLEVPFASLPTLSASGRYVAVRQGAGSYGRWSSEAVLRVIDLHTQAELARLQAIAAIFIGDDARGADLLCETERGELFEYRSWLQEHRRITLLGEKEFLRASSRHREWFVTEFRAFDPSKMAFDIQFLRVRRLSDGRIIRQWGAGWDVAAVGLE